MGTLERCHLFCQEKKEDVWHRRYGHLGVRNLRKLAKDNLVNDFDYDISKEISFCEPCTNGKHHRSSFLTSGAKRAGEPVGLVHGDVCGIGEKSLSGIKGGDPLNPRTLITGC